MAEDMSNDIEIGKKLRALRKIRGISLQQMARETGMSYSYLSGLENGKHSVSITNLQRIASFFQVDMIYFLQPCGPVPRVIRRSDTFDQSSTYEDISYRVMTPADSSYLQVSYVYMPPHSPSERNIHKHGKGQELVLTLSGVTCVMVEDERYRLEMGDSILFEADIEHLIYTEEQPSTFVIISSPPYGQDIPSNHQTKETP